MFSFIKNTNYQHQINFIYRQMMTTRATTTTKKQLQQELKELDIIDEKLANIQTTLAAIYNTEVSDNEEHNAKFWKKMKSIIDKIDNLSNQYSYN